MICQLSGSMLTVASPTPFQLLSTTGVTPLTPNLVGAIGPLANAPSRAAYRIDRPGAPGLPPSHPTLPSLLKARGYRTALFGKWHLGELPQHGPLKSGYDVFFGNHGGALGIEFVNGPNPAITRPGRFAELFFCPPDLPRRGPQAHGGASVLE